MSLLVALPSGKTLCVDACGVPFVSLLKQHICNSQAIPVNEQYASACGRTLLDTDAIGVCHPTITISLRLNGGKGGFGSMLRAMGGMKSGFETDNVESCRDLSGRRLRHVNDEKRIVEWLAKQKDAAAEKEKRKEERLERKLKTPTHLFDHHSYHVGLHDAALSVEDSTKEGVKAGLKKRPLGGAEPLAAKKPRIMGDDLCTSSSSSGDEEDLGLSGQTVSLPLTTTPDAPIPAAAREEKGVAVPVVVKKKTPEFVQKPARTQSIQSTKASEQSTKTSFPSVEVNESNTKTAPAPAARSVAVTPMLITPEFLDLAPFASLEALEAVGLDRLKAALLFLNVKCGGTLQQRAERLFSLKGVSPDKIPKHLRAATK